MRPVMVLLDPPSLDELGGRLYLCPAATSASIGWAAGDHASRSVPLKIAAALVLVGIGFAVGTGISSSRHTTAASVVTVTVTNPARTAPGHHAPASPVPTRASAVAAAAQSITAFDGRVLLDPSRVEAVVKRIASTESRASLLSAFEQASTQTREKLGAGTAPSPVDRPPVDSGRLPRGAVLRAAGYGRRLVRRDRRQRRDRAAAAVVAYPGRVPGLGEQRLEGELVRERRRTDASALDRGDPGNTRPSCSGRIPLFKEFAVLRLDERRCARLGGALALLLTRVHV